MRISNQYPLSLQGGQRKFLFGAAILLAWLVLPTHSFAQSNPAAENDAGLLEEVIVTATRREQTIQEVPMSVSAFTGEQLAQLQADNLNSIQGAVPNLNLVKGRGSNSSVNIFIRGVGQPDALQTFDPAIGLYLDDVYMSRIQGGMFKLYDIERVEVLRGPQGTLYGKNTPGGAIRLITKTPGQEFESQAGVLFGNYGRFQAKGYVSGPVSDTFSLGFSVLYDEHDGFVTDPSDGRKYNDEDTIVTRLKGNWDVSDDVNIVFSADYTKEDVAMSLGRAEAALLSIDLGTGLPVLLQPAPTGKWNFETVTDMGDLGGQKTDNYGGNVTLNWDINDRTSFKSITAYRKLQSDLYIDIDASEWSLGNVFVGIDQSQFSQEFQLLGDNGENLNWVAGLYYLNEKVPSHQDAWADNFLLFFGVPITYMRTVDDDLNTKSYAAFGQVDWQFADRWTLGAGVRFTYEKKDYFRTTSTFTNLLGNADPAYTFDDSDHWSDWTPTFTLDYDMNDNVRLYGRLSNGFKSGGFNGRANLPSDKGSFDPETVWSAEIGAKTIMADGKFQANYAVFASKYDDFQARVSIGEGLEASLPVLNAATLDIWGAEAEFIWAPTDALQFNSQIGYLNSTYGDEGFSGADGVEDEPAFSPKWTARFAGIYTFFLSGGSTLSLNAAASYRDSMWLGVDNLVTLWESDYWVLDAFISWTSQEGKWNVIAGIKNAGDKEYKVDGQEFRSVGNIQTAYYGDPRTYTLSLNYKF